MAEFRGDLYVVGGLDGVTSGSTRVLRLELSSGSNVWVALNELGENRFAAGLVVVNDSLYLVGGLFEPGNAPQQVRATLFVYLPDQDAWELRAPLPEGRFNAGIGAVGGRIYVVGGLNAALTPTSTNFVYDPATDSWATAAELPNTRSRGVAIGLDGRLWVVGRSPGSPVVDVYDPATDAWTTGPALSTARVDPAVAVLAGRLHVLGGDFSGAHEALDPGAGTVVPLRELAQAWRRGAAVGIAGNVWFAGGIDGVTRSARVEVFSS